VRAPSDLPILGSSDRVRLTKRPQIGICGRTLPGKIDRAERGRSAQTVESQSQTLAVCHTACGGVTYGGGTVNDIKELAIAYRKWTKYSVAGTFPLALAGLWLILLTFPNVFYAIGRSGLPVGMSALLEGAHHLTVPVLNQQQIMFGSINAYLVVALPVLVWVLMAAGLFRSARVRSWTPALSMLVNLCLGVIAFPFFAWVAQIVVWIVGFGGLVAGWVSSLFANGVVRVVGMIVGGALLLALLVGLGIWAAKSVRARWGLAVVVTMGAALYMSRDAITTLLGPVVSAVAGAVATVIGVVVIVIVAIVAWLVAILVLAYLGSSMITPIRDSFKAGREAGAFADVAAGVGVAVSTIITAASYSQAGPKNLAVTLGEANLAREALPLGSLPNLLDLRFETIMPHSFDPLLEMLFTGFNATPDLLLVALVCAFGALALMFASGPIASMQEAPATIVTFAFLRYSCYLVALCSHFGSQDLIPPHRPGSPEYHVTRPRIWPARRRSCRANSQRVPVPDHVALKLRLRHVALTGLVLGGAPRTACG
jgi:hypothetical protein